MCKVEMLRALLNQRLSAALDEVIVVFQGTIAEYEEELSRTKQENERQRQLLDTVLQKSHDELHRADICNNKELHSEQQELVHIKDEEEPEHPQVKEKEEDNSPNSPFTFIPVNSEEDEDKRPSEKNGGPELPCCSSKEHIPTEDDGDHCRGSQADTFAALSDSDNKTSFNPDDEHSKDVRKQDFYLEQQEWGSWVAQEEQKPLHTQVEEDLQLPLKEMVEEAVLPYIKKEEETVALHVKEEKEEAINNFPLTVLVKCKANDDKNDNLSGGSQADRLYNSANVMPHTDQEHAKGDAMQWECSQCGKIFRSKWGMKLHMRIHTGEKLFSCSFCGKLFAKISHLKAHTRTHTGEKPYACLFCSKRFAVKEHLKMHTRMHTGEKPFHCSVCGKQFAHKGHLNIHVRSHTGEKPFVCSVCTLRFNERSGLSQHMRTHTGEKPYQCGVCAKSFTRRKQVKKHKCAG